MWTSVFNMSSYNAVDEIFGSCMVFLRDIVSKPKSNLKVDSSAAAVPHTPMTIAAAVKGEPICQTENFEMRNSTHLIHRFATECYSSKVIKSRLADALISYSFLLAYRFANKRYSSDIRKCRFPTPKRECIFAAAGTLYADLLQK